MISLRASGIALSLVFASSVGWASTQSVLDGQDCQALLRSPSHRLWLPPIEVRQSAKPLGVVVLLHGMTLSPSTMDPIAASLNEGGLETWRVTFSGHFGNRRDLEELSYLRWTHETFTAYCAARARADQLGVPLHLIGHSMGGVFIQKLINLRSLYPSARERVRIDSAVMIAPVLVTVLDATPAFLGRFLGAIGKGKPELPSHFPYGKYEPMDKYGATVADAFRLHWIGYSDSWTVPTLLQIHSKDPMADAAGYREIAREFGIGHAWKVQVIDDPALPVDVPRPHIILDPQTSGRAWENQIQSIRGFIAGVQLQIGGLRR